MSVAFTGRRITGPAEQLNMKTNSLAPQVGALRVVLAIAMAGSCVFAQADPKEQNSAASSSVEETQLPPVTVSAHEGVAVPYDQTGVSVTILDSRELQREGVQTLNEALTRVPGLYILPGGGVGQRGNYSKAVIRGMNQSDYNLTMVDGMRLYRVGANVGPDFLSQTPMFSLGNIEVVKGSQGAVYGGGAIGGVIATETPTGSGPASVKIFNEVGSFDSYTGYIAAQGAEGKWDYFVAAGYERTNNDIDFATYQPVPKHGGKFTQWEEAVRLGYQISEDAKLTMTYRRQDAEYDNYSGSGVMLHDNYDFMSQLATVKLDAKIDKVWTTSLMAGYYGWDPTLGNYSDYGYGTSYSASHYNLRNVQVEWRNALKWNEKNETTAGVAWNRSQFRSEWEARNLENIYGLFAEHLYKPVPHWDNSFALRLDHSTTWNNQWTYRYATSWKVTGEHSATRLFGSFGSGYRSPSQFERYADYNAMGYLYKGNPDLKVSKSLSGDLGIEQRVAETHAVALTGFWTRVNDQISTAYPPDFSYATYKNYSHATSVGLELALRGDFGDAWNSGYSIAYTYVVPKNSEDRQLAFTARSAWSADIHTSPVQSVTTGLGLVAANGRVGIQNGQRTDNYCVLRWYAQWQATKNLAFHIRVENMTNDKYVLDEYSTAVSAGTAVYGGFTLTF